MIAIRVIKLGVKSRRKELLDSFSGIGTTSAQSNSTEIKFGMTLIVCAEVYVDVAPYFSSRDVLHCVLQRVKLLGPHAKKSPPRKAADNAFQQWCYGFSAVPLMAAEC
jgi:hypothetical protein